MTQRYCISATTSGLLIVGFFACTVANPHARRQNDAGMCTANQALRCDGNSLVRCNDEGTGEVSETCSISCDATQLVCGDLAPSNGLAEYLDMASVEANLDLGESATINTDTGDVTASSAQLPVHSNLVAQSGAPMIRVLYVRSLTAKDVMVTGRSAIAIVSSGDIEIRGAFTASAKDGVSGAGAFYDGDCRGGVPTSSNDSVHGGYGGGGFGSPGGAGGTAINSAGTSAGGPGGSPTGNELLIPLRGGCSGGPLSTSYGSGGGAIQLVSRSQIVVSGVVATNGSSAGSGGSGGAILFEAPIIEVTGNVVANGGAGTGGCAFAPPAENGRLDATPAMGGPGCPDTVGGAGGNGGAGTSVATKGADVDTRPMPKLALGGNGGGGFGRIRVNTAVGGLHTTGMFSPTPSLGSLMTR